MLDCSQLQGEVARVSLVESCDEIRNGMLRLATPFRYPEGSQIDLFLGADDGLLRNLFLTDLGQTIAGLLDLHIKPWTTKKRKQIVSDICKALDVSHVDGEFRVNLESLKDLPGAMVRLAQACIRTSDLAFTQRNMAAGGFRDEVEEFISSLDLPYDAAVEFPGVYGRPVPVDFSVMGKNVPTLVLTLSGIPGSAHPLANEVFRKWHDLSPMKTSHQFLSICDMRRDVFRDDDLARIGEVSSVLAFPDQEGEIREALAA